MTLHRKSGVGSDVLVPLNRHIGEKSCMLGPYSILSEQRWEDLQRVECTSGRYGM